MIFLIYNNRENGLQKKVFSDDTSWEDVAISVHGEIIDLFKNNTLLLKDFENYFFSLVKKKDKFIKRK